VAFLALDRVGIPSGSVSESDGREVLRSGVRASVGGWFEAARGEVVVLDLFDDVVLEARVGAGGVGGGFVGGTVDGGEWFLARSGEGGVRGVVLLPLRGVAYRLRGTGAGGMVVEEYPLDAVVCGSVSGGGVVGMPRPRRDGVVRRAAAAGATEVPLLESRPGAAAVIYLDFDGEVVSGTAWNGGARIEAAPARLLESGIREVWARVAEDFRVFDVNVTTDRAVHDAAQMNRRTHCVITPTDTASPGAGGVAYIGSFGNPFSDYKICWVFADENPKDCAEVASHEVGHTLGLSHDGRLAGDGQGYEEYYEGHGAGETGWAPIMGVGYYRQLTQWSKGEYARANNTEDDVYLISLYTPLIADAEADNQGTAQSVVGDYVEGVIGSPFDADVFRVTLGAGNHTLVAQPTAYSNVDVSLEVLDAGGGSVGFASPELETGARVELPFASAGDYFLVVRGAGKSGLPAAGYSTYGSLGGYGLTGFGDQALPPRAPGGLSVGRVSGSVVDLVWQASATATAYKVYRNGVVVVETAGTSLRDGGLLPSSRYSYRVGGVNVHGEGAPSNEAVVITPGADEFLMDGVADFDGYLLNNEGMRIHAAVRGTRLYVATWSPGDSGAGFGSDHFVIVSDEVQDPAATPAPWAKRGLVGVPAGKPFLAGESSSTYAAWFNAGGSAVVAKSPVNSGVLEGSIDLVEEFGAVPPVLYVAALAYQTNDNGPGDDGRLFSQGPSGDGDDTVSADEFLLIKTGAAADAALNGVYDVLDGARGFRVDEVEFGGDGVVRVGGDGVPGVGYRLMRSPSLVTPDWKQVAEGVGADDWRFELRDEEAPAGACFYRVELP
jgi:hypothetical protein